MINDAYGKLLYITWNLGICSTQKQFSKSVEQYRWLRYAGSHGCSIGPSIMQTDRVSALAPVLLHSLQLYSERYIIDLIQVYPPPRGLILAKNVSEDITNDLKRFPVALVRKLH